MNRVLFILPKGRTPNFKNETTNIRLISGLKEEKFSSNDTNFKDLLNGPGGKPVDIIWGPSAELIENNYVYIVPDDNKIKVYRGGLYEEFTLEEASVKLKDTYDSIDYIVYENKPVKEYLSNFNYIIDTFKEYTSPELGVLFTDYYRSGQSFVKHEFIRSFTPESFMMNIPPVLIINKKYLQGLPMSVDQQVATYLINSCPVLHVPEASYILE